MAEALAKSDIPRLLTSNLLAVYENSAGASLAQTPLAYHENMSLYTPALTSQSSSCSTNAIDGAVEAAAETLAKEMASVMPRLGQPIEANPIQPQVASRRTQTQTQTQTYQQQAVSPSVQFRTKLVDANRNLVLEGGETIVLLIETTNISDTDLPSAYVELSGTPALVNAFKRVVSLPVPLGTLKAGEKRTAEIRGRLGSISKFLSRVNSLLVLFSQKAFLRENIPFARKSNQDSKKSSSR